ncbi:SDR family NAD(P)-dependent oxidoreductase [Alicyclobacillus dauci]|uniref:SDR family oxidoreductase n=1 Tax=Alicyclobacillus dauci TaxID=1475485 RepID=A0ABY6YYN8_9BACL|nr:SDR family NAD(P)-dependent oxidoreductase [Alicyclobacillus dauci]WAH35702.1 SDR family oxidoreductase [Alicyclobacillus dauci]
MKLKNQVSWVTGAAGGIGKCISEKLAAQGSHLILSDINASALNELLVHLSGFDVDILVLPLDVADPQTVSEGGQKIRERFGRVDNLINNAGISPKGPKGPIPFKDITFEDWNRVIAVNLNGPFLCSQVALEMMVAHGHGSLVNICSQAARTHSPVTSAHYAASKSGLLGLSRKLAGEYGPYGIRVNVVVPGRIDTPMTQSVNEELSRQAALRTPLRRIGQPNEVADAVLYLVSNEASYVNGAILDVNGGSLMI